MKNFLLLFTLAILTVSSQLLAAQKPYKVESINNKKAFYEFEDKTIEGQNYKIIKNKTEYSKKELEAEISSIQDKIQRLQDELAKRTEMLDEFSK